jgi:hypothetical protein
MIGKSGGCISRTASKNRLILTRDRGDMAAWPGLSVRRIHRDRKPAAEAAG